MLCRSMLARKAPLYEDTPEHSFLMGLLPSVMMVPQAQRHALQLEMIKLICRFLPQANPGMSVSYPSHPYPMAPPTPANPWFPYQYPPTSQAWDNSQNSAFTDL
ncbi:hypothetical protein XENTR_v10013333 [Xenopus tropicalis]|nr:hypothetical protein XENTR_v10013333 [Xenopus tropicalis]